MADKYERFVAAFLRLNAYFCVPNFIVHAADDPARISAGHVGNYTETDIIGVRMPYSAETTGALSIVNFQPLTSGTEGRFDAVIVEVKSGKETRPNAIWRASAANATIEYIVRFVGLYEPKEIGPVADRLATQFSYEDARSRVRYLVFAPSRNRHYEAAGVTYITFREAIEFLVTERGQCWINSDIGVASVHQQWDDLLVAIFEMANKHQLTPPERIAEIERYLAS
jgi:hypothetical protein